MFHCAASSVLHRLFSSCGTRASHCSGFSASLLWNMHLGHVGFSSCSTWTQELQLSGSRAQAEWLWPTGLVAPQHEGSFRIRDGTRVSCIGRQTPYHWATREALLLLLLSRFSRVRLCATHRRQPTRPLRPWDSPGKNTGVDCHVLLKCMKVKSESEVAQSCPTLSDPMVYSLSGSSVHGIFQARVLEWVAIEQSLYNVRQN